MKDLLEMKEWAEGMLEITAGLKEDSWSSASSSFLDGTEFAYKRMMVRLNEMIERWDADNPSNESDPTYPNGYWDDSSELNQYV